MATEYEKGKKKAEEELAALYESDTVSGEFADSSISRYAGFALDGEEAERGEDGRPLTKEAVERKRQEEQAAVLREEVIERARRSSASVIAEERRTANMQARAMKQAQLRGSTGSLTARGTLGKFGNTTLIGATFVAYGIQFLFGLVSLSFIGMTAFFETLTSNKFIGTIVNVVKKVASFFVDLQNFALIENLGLAFWALSALVACISFFACLILFSFTEREVVYGPWYMLLITSVVFACSILPVTNLFPWIPLWVILINFLGIIHLAKGAARFLS